MNRKKPENILVDYQVRNGAVTNFDCFLADWGTAYHFLLSVARALHVELDIFTEEVDLEPVCDNIINEARNLLSAPTTNSSNLSTLNTL